MTRLSKRFSDDDTQLIPYIMGGWPDPDSCYSAIATLAESGCTVIEIGVPYSDPLADGPTIQKAGEAALAAGITTDDVLSIIAKVTSALDVSIVMMVYYNLIYRYGLDRFAKAAADAGVEGVIVPDLTVEESAGWRRSARENGLDTIFLAAPTSSPGRLKKIVDASSGFVYTVSLTGVTGARAELPNNLAGFVVGIKELTDLPVAVGFGVSRPEQAGAIAHFADGVIVGSALIDLIEKSPAADREANVSNFANALLTSMKEGAKDASL